MKVVDIFAGPGGWSQGISEIGIRDVGLEWDRDACLTRAAAGHLTVRANVAQYPPDAFAGYEGLIASPPCQAWSTAGKGDARLDLPKVHEAVSECAKGWDPRVISSRDWIDMRTPLVLEPLRWAWLIRPQWITCEQVPPALPVWEHMCEILRGWGYSAHAVVLSAEQWGVPQTRKRAFLMASRGSLSLPMPTHQRYRSGEGSGEAEECQPSLFGLGLKPWVSAAEALDLAKPLEIKGNQKTDGVYQTREVSSPAQTLTRNTRFWHLRTSFGEPHRGKKAGSPKPEFNPTAQPSRTVTGKSGSWLLTRPSTTVVGSFSPHKLTPPGHRDWSSEGASRQASEGAVHISLEQAAVLQGFPADYPFVGSKSSKFRQCGDAVPPAMARAVVEAVSGRAA